MTHHSGIWDPRIWHSRGYLPHVDPDGFLQFITFRLADSMPQKVLDNWREDLKNGLITDTDLRKRIETYLDQNYGSRALQQAEIAELVEAAILRFDGELYRLIAWVIMPNHVHLLLERFEHVSLSSVMHSIKSYTAHEANRLLGKKGRFWSKEYFDRFIRDRRHYVAVIRYIEENPVKARLCARPEDWLYSSARRRV